MHVCWAKQGLALADGQVVASRTPLWAVFLQGRGWAQQLYVTRATKSLIHRLKKTSVNSAYYQILTCCHMFFLLFIRAQYESEPQVSMLYCNSIC